ncbi:MAG: hypothetical protein J2P29_09980 [Actinobacteria bacterium]|nr:hypothetical protein [Actinomycetota bacterium]
MSAPGFLTAAPSAASVPVEAQAGVLPNNANIDQVLASSAARARPATTPKAAPKRTAAPHPSPSPTAAPVYLNPLRAVAGLMPQRIDMGADFAGSGPVYPIGDAIITNATGSDWGWPGGGWITYQLTNGPAAGLMVFVAEDVRPAVQVGQHVTPETVIANMFQGGAGIETGWATADAHTAESQLAVAGAVGGGGPFPTMVGVNFDQLLVTLGVPAAPNAGQAAYGVLPPNYPRSWAGLGPG